MHTDSYAQITLYKQIHPCQCTTLAKMGYKSLINLRFDDETDAQPKSAAIGDSATAAGLEYQHLPVDGEHIERSLVADFARLLQEIPKPVLVFCGTGSRAKRMYQNALIEDLI